MVALPKSFIRYMRERREREAALGYRGYGKRALADTLAEIEGALKGNVGPDVNGDDPEDPSLLQMLGDVADPDRYDHLIPRDHDAMDALENLAFAIGIAFDLGRYAPSLNPEEAAAKGELLRRTLGYREGQKNATLAKIKKGPLPWKAAAHEMLEADGGRSSHDKITDLICDKLKSLRLNKSRRTVYNEVFRWRAAARLAG